MLPVAKVEKLMADLSAKFEAQIGKLGNQVLSKAAAATQPKEAGTKSKYWTCGACGDPTASSPGRIATSAVLPGCRSHLALQLPRQRLRRRQRRGPRRREPLRW